MIVGVYNPPTLVTMTGLVCGLSACMLAFTGRPELAVVALIWAGIFDLFDGLVARRTRMTEQEASFGIQIDSIVDMVSFGIAPVVVAMSLGMTNVFGVIAAGLYVCAAAQRLAYFNVLQQEAGGGLKTYTGLPVTFSALIFGTLFALRDVLSEDVFAIFLPALFAIVSFLYVYPAKIPKPGGAVYT
ncbi:MAG TPA: CDP-alcohol phosphatidyltransferase family protein, partial [Dongiaceae bacterium]|nr:CDP-alcohol phosphatidyltransferase family protein [Dongiaceae bacterium]